MWGLLCLALAAAVGDQHAQEDSQHAAGLAGHHCCPQCWGLLHQAGCGIHAAGTALGTWLAPQQSPRAALWESKLPGRLGSTLLQPYKEKDG